MRKKFIKGKKKKKPKPQQNRRGWEKGRGQVR